MKFRLRANASKNLARIWYLTDTSVYKPDVLGGLVHVKRPCSFLLYSGSATAVVGALQNVVGSAFKSKCKALKDSSPPKRVCDQWWQSVAEAWWASHLLSVISNVCNTKTACDFVVSIIILFAVSTNRLPAVSSPTGTQVLGGVEGVV